MWKLAIALAEIALRRRGPETLPDSTFLLLLILGADVFVSLALWVAGASLSSRSLMLLAIDLTLVMAFHYAVLTFFKLERRFRQTMSAILGADLWVTATFLVLLLFALGMGSEATVQSLVWVQLGLQLWLLYISGWVLARSLSQPLIVGFMFEILYFLTVLGIGNILFPTVADLASTST